MVFKKENKGSTSKRDLGNEDDSIDNGPTLERRKRKEEDQVKEEEERIDNDQVDKDKDEPKCEKKEENDDDMMVTLSPMEIRAFIMEVTY